MQKQEEQEEEKEAGLAYLSLASVLGLQINRCRRQPVVMGAWRNVLP